MDTPKPIKQLRTSPQIMRSVLEIRQASFDLIDTIETVLRYSDLRSNEPDMSAVLERRCHTLRHVIACTPIQDNPPKPDVSLRKPRMLYYEDAEDCWCFAGADLESYVSLNHMEVGEVGYIAVKREDLTDEEVANAPEI